jgi:phage terminase large subunit-like protein
MLVISTQAADSYAPLSQLIDYGLNMQREEKSLDPAFHVTLYAAPEDADPWSREAWDKANPALGDFRSLEDVERLAGQAQRIPTQENTFRNLILNQRVAMESRFMNPIAWKECGGEANIPPGVKVYAGLDLGSTRDLSALVIARKDDEGLCHVKNFCWVPGDLALRETQEGVPYPLWEKQGFVIAAGPATDPRAIATKIAEVNRVNPILELAFDRWRIPELKREMDAIGCTVPLVEHGQGFKDMTGAVDIVDRLVTYRQLRHGNNPVLTWCAVNAVIVRDAVNGMKFDKSINRYRNRIDCLVAMSMALNLLLVKNKPRITDVEALIG